MTSRYRIHLKRGVNQSTLYFVGCDILTPSLDPPPIFQVHQDTIQSTLGCMLSDFLNRLKYLALSKALSAIALPGQETWPRDPFGAFLSAVNDKP